MKKRLVNLFLVAFISCNSNQSKTDEVINSETLIETPESNENETVKNWLVESIESYFKIENSKMETLTTNRYAQYKTDAMNVNLDVEGSLTQQEFDEKWKNDYDTKLAGYNSGFLISGQDWINPTVTRCDLKGKSNNTFIFETTITDDGYKINYIREIMVVREKGNLKIDNVIDLN